MKDPKKVVLSQSLIKANFSDKKLFLLGQLCDGQSL